MRSSTDTTTKTMLVLALLAALAVLLRLGENLLPLPVQLGAIRPGLANTITILCLYLFGPQQFIIPSMFCILAALFINYRKATP